MAHTVILQDDEEIIKKSDLKILLDRLEKYEGVEEKLKKADEKMAILGRCSFQVMQLIGLIDPSTNKIWKTIMEKKQSPIGKIIKGVTATTLTLGRINMLGSKKEAEIEMERKFGFVKEFMPLVDEFNFTHKTLLGLPEPKKQLE